jgi:hypothetical protein
MMMMMMMKTTVMILQMIRHRLVLFAHHCPRKYEYRQEMREDHPHQHQQHLHHLQ